MGVRHTGIALFVVDIGVLIVLMMYVFILDVGQNWKG